MNNHLQEKIDLYHSGRMNSEEAATFEKELASDPTLKAESNFQKDIISGLQDYRKAQLKVRLDALDLSPTWFEFVQQSTLLKSFGGVAVATMIGAGVYFLAEPESRTKTEEDIIINAPEEFVLDFEWNIIPTKIFPDQVTIPPKSTPIVVHEAVEEITSENWMTEKKSDNVHFNPDFEAPTAEDIKDEEALKTAVLENLPQTSTSNVDAEPIDVDYENTKALNVKYKYYDGKLFLSGDFDKAPYEILEINSADGRRIYVKYLEKFYKVGITDKMTALPEVTDVNVIEELKLLRQNK